MNISDEQLMAYADGELDAAQRLAIEAALAQDAQLAARLRQHRALRSRLQSAHEPMLGEPVPQRFLDLLKAGEPARRDAQVLAFKPRAAKPATAPAPAARRLPFWGALAASALLGVVASVVALRSGNRANVEMVAGVMVARGALANALNNQLAATQDRMAAIHLDLSYRDRAGAYCRVFGLRSQAALSGVACRQGSEWQLQMLTASPGNAGTGSAYQQAGSGMPDAVLKLVQSQINGEPLDSAAEARAAGAGWR